MNRPPLHEILAALTWAAAKATIVLYILIP